MRDILPFLKLLILISSIFLIKTKDLNSTNYSCSTLLKSNELLNLSESFSLKIEESFGFHNNNLSDFIAFLSNYQDKIKNASAEFEDEFSFSEGTLSCKIIISSNYQKLNSTRLLQARTTCEKNHQCFQGTYTNEQACVERFVNGVEVYTTAVNGGLCIDNTCSLVSDPDIVLVLTKNREMTRGSSGAVNGKCLCSSTTKCLDTVKKTCIPGEKGKLNNQDQLECNIGDCDDSSKCYDENFNCVDITGSNLKNLDGACYSVSCTYLQAVITADTNLLAVDLSTDGASVTVQFTDPDGVLNNVNPTVGQDRYTYQVYLTDENGNFKGTEPTYIKGTSTFDVPVSITVTKAEIDSNCDLVDGSNALKGRKCYFMAVVADTCSYLKNLIVYTHLAERTFNTDGTGIYALETDLKVDSEFEDLRVDYCSYIAEDCILSTDYAYVAALCPSAGNSGCGTPLTSGHTYRRNNFVHVRVFFQNADGSVLATTTRHWVLDSAMIKLYDKDENPISVNEKPITITSQEYLDNYLYFTFLLEPSLLFYDDETLISKVLKLLMVIEVTGSRRILEVKIEPKEVLPQLGNLLTLGIDEKDYNNYKLSMIAEDDDKNNNKKVIIAVVCSVLGFILVCTALLIYFCCLKKKNNNKANEEVAVDTISVGEKIQPKTIKIQMQDAESNI